MTSTIDEPKLRDYEGGSNYVRDSEGNAVQIVSLDGKRVLWQADNYTEPAVTNISEELSDVENTEQDRLVPSTTNVSTTHKPNPRKSLTPADAQGMREARLAGATILEIATKSGFGQTTVKGALQGIKPLSNPVTQPVTSIIPDFSGVENTELPYSVQNAIRISLDTATHQAILGEGPVKAFFEGYISGFNIALGIICGTSGIDISFLEEQSDDSTSNTQQ